MPSKTPEWAMLPMCALWHPGLLYGPYRGFTTYLQVLNAHLPHGLRILLAESLLSSSWSHPSTSAGFYTEKVLGVHLSNERYQQGGAQGLVQAERGQPSSRTPCLGPRWPLHWIRWETLVRKTKSNHLHVVGP